ncbi:unnamed protein product [Chondrus crispus]|uniref:Zinc-finger domain-containing protein n=1 Tax=Chondrus crispus TaxID=2769 RepID=R7QHZ4_CHOCR|nr:unnamed protein product [Chondrus crispus]CDF37020.1 unnamed protein product [Chondrus crispus]|eukprot:XP_005716839.1 unnamed protein product [Chondrus crispus]
MRRGRHMPSPPRAHSQTRAPAARFATRTRRRSKPPRQSPVATVVVRADGVAPLQVSAHVDHVQPVAPFGQEDGGPLLVQKSVDPPAVKLVEPPPVQELPEPPPPPPPAPDPPDMPEVREAKHVKRASLLLLRKKVLMSIKQKKKAAASAEPEVRTPSVSMDGFQDPAASAVSLTESMPEGGWKRPRESTPRSASPVLSSKGTTSGSDLLIVEFSDSDFEEDNHDGKLSYIAVERKARPQRKRPRHEIIESMKIRLVQLGRCPSSLHGNPKQAAKPTSTPVKTDKNRAGSSELAATVTSAEVMDRATRAPKVVKMRNDTTIAAIDSSETTNGGKDSVLPAPLDKQGVNGNASQNRLAAATVKELPVLPEPTESETARPTSAALLKEDISSNHSSSSKTVSPLRNADEATGTSSEKNTEAPGSFGKIPARASSMKKPPLGSTGVIAALRKRITDLEKSKKTKKLTPPPSHERNTNALTNPLSVESGKFNNFSRKRPHSETAVPPHVQPAFKCLSLVRVTDLKDEIPNSLAPNEQGRYYSTAVQGTTKTRRRKLPPKKPTGNTGSAAEQGRWNRRDDEDSEAVFDEDYEEPGLVDDLKLELASSKKQLASVTDYVQLVNASDVSLAQASAKLSFKRAALSNLSDLMKRAEFEVLDAEQDLEKITNAARRMRESLVDGPFADMFPMPEIARTGGEGRGTGASPGGYDLSSATSQSDGGVPTDAENGDKVADGLDALTRTDLVLQASPYSPSSGFFFLSCLSGLRAYVLRTPYHSRAADRKSTSPLSLTWTHNLDPMKTICPKELRRQYSCASKKCQYEHLRNFESMKGHALDVTDRLQGFADMSKEDAEKQVVRAKLDIYSNKNVDNTVSFLITSLFPIPSPDKLPLKKRT